MEATIRRLSSLGYDQLEISGEPERHDTSAILKLLKEHEMSCYGSVTLMMDGRNLLAKCADERSRSVQYVKDCVTMVHELEGQSLSVVPGTVGKVVPDGRPDDEWKIAVESMQEIYAHAEPLGVKLGIEPINRFETYFINRGAQAMALAEATGPNCGVCLDIFHMNLEEVDYLQTIRDCASRLVGFHVADSNRMAPGQGHLDWSAVVKTLREISYQGPLSVEFSPPVDRTPANPYPEAIDDDPEGLSDEQRKFLEDHGSAALKEEWYTWLTKQAIDHLRSVL